MDLVRTGTTATPTTTRPRPMARPFVLATAFLSIAAASLAVLLIATAIWGSANQTGGSVVDTSYDQVEQVRGAILAPTGLVDTSYDQVEQVRGAIPGG